MSSRIISDPSGRFHLSVEVNDAVLEGAVDHNHAERVFKCAFLMALSALAQDGPWPDAVLESMSSFMVEMRTSLIEELH